MNFIPLDSRALERVVNHLSGVDSDLDYVVKKYGIPPLWARDEGFPTLVHIILEQQVSLASAKAAFDKLKKIAKPLTPQRFLELDDLQLKKVGFSRQKTTYCRNLSHSILDGELDLSALGSLGKVEVREKLTRIKGIGEWTANIYLLMALLHPDIWPKGDLALVIAIQKLKNLSQRPDSFMIEEISEKWRPWRAVAARILWHLYLNNRDK